MHSNWRLPNLGDDVLDDVVVDTNIFAHAQNPAEPRFSDAGRFLRTLLDCETKLCVDRLFALDHKNSSLIGSEYLSTINAGGTSFEVLRMLLVSDRVKSVPGTVPPNVRKRVVRIRNRRDRTFVSVAYNSDEHVLVSHDRIDFPDAIRESLKAEIGVTIADASPATALL
jgi:hypothetical protein